MTAADLRGVDSLSDSEWARETPDAHITWPPQGRRPGARCSIWWRDVPPLPSQRVGAVGHFSVASPPAAAEVLRRACATLGEHGCTVAIGPMNRNTWYRYRFVTEPGPEPPFFLEPWNPQSWPAYFLEAGFQPLAQYQSYLIDLGTRATHYATAARRLLEERGISVRPLDPEALEAELRSLHALALEAFAHNVLFTPLPFDDFLAIYRPLVPHIDPRLVLLAFDGADLAGFVFGIPDQNGPPGPARPRTMIIKTLAARRGRRLAGLGGALVDRCHERAFELGYARCIHALVHQGAPSANISPKYGRVMRQYTLFARPCSP